MIYGEFVWWQGVVEDRDDPLKLGRCRVRIVGYHTDDKKLIPTTDLPWATPMQPITSAAMSGVGTTPIGPVRGTWCFGFFRDGKDAQEPVFIGTFGGRPQEPADPKLGFNDPVGLYPLQTHLNEPDTNRLARGIGKMPVGSKNGENHASLIWKRKTRQTGVPKAVAGDLQGTDALSLIIANEGNYYDFDYWNEPNPRYGGTKDSATEYLTPGKLPDGEPYGKTSSKYPYNHVRQSESGHVEEWDDTPGAERLHRYHKSATFEEIQPDGTRVVKVVGNDYEIIARDKRVLVNGDCEVTIMGDCRLQVQGTMVHEVLGNYHLNVHGDMRTKIAGNDVKSVGSDSTEVVNGSHSLSVGSNDFLTIGGNEQIKISGTDTTIVTGSYDLYSLADITQASVLGSRYFAATTMDINSLGIMSLATAGIMNQYAGTTWQAYSSGPMIQTSMTTYNLNVALASTFITGLSESHLVGGIFSVRAPLILLN